MLGEFMIDVCGLIELFWILLSIRVVLGTLSVRVW